MSSDAGPIHLLLVEDDERLARLTARYLQSHGVEVVHAATGDDALALGTKHAFDVVLLDVMLPGLSGVGVCRALRAHSDVPILMVTAVGEESDRVLGLEEGADDYITKPFSSRELLARVRAHVRRARGLSGPQRDEAIAVGPLRIDPDSRTATLDGKELTLTSYEFTLLKVLAERAGRVLSREALLDLAKGSADEAFDRSIDVRISRLRQKLGDDPKKPRLLKTVRSAGYMLSLLQDAQ
jgi:DNA-binding response OmpR family regulator